MVSRAAWWSRCKHQRGRNRLLQPIDRCVDFKQYPTSCYTLSLWFASGTKIGRKKRLCTSVLQLSRRSFWQTFIRTVIFSLRSGFDRAITIVAKICHDFLSTYLLGTTRRIWRLEKPKSYLRLRGVCSTVLWKVTALSFLAMSHLASEFN